MKNILDNDQLDNSQAWREATEENTALHPILQKYPDLKTIIDYGRWAPSGDNIQPWRFKLTDGSHFDIYGFDTREHCVYDLNGHASQLSLGMLLENLSIGASLVGKKMNYQIDSRLKVDKPIIHIHILNSEAISSALASEVILRSVNRHCFSRKKILSAHKKIVEQAAYPLKVKWFEGASLYKTTRLFYDAAGIRLSIPEAYPTHASIIEWEKNYSRDKMPVNTLGASWFVKKIMHFALNDWSRVKFLNRYMAGTLLPRIELDIIPGLFSGAHFILLADKEPKSLDDFLKAGQLVQRFWLTMNSLAIQLQPQMTGLIFSNYFRLNTRYTKVKKQWQASEKLYLNLVALIGKNNIAKSVFMGRVGYGERVSSRSTRLSLNIIVE